MNTIELSLLRDLREKAKLIVSAVSELPALIDQINEMEKKITTAITYVERGCECGLDDACLFVRERDAAITRAESAERENIYLKN